MGNACEQIAMSSVNCAQVSQILLISECSTEVKL